MLFCHEIRLLVLDMYVLKGKLNHWYCCGITAFTLCEAKSGAFFNPGER